MTSVFVKLKLYMVIDRPNSIESATKSDLSVPEFLNPVSSHIVDLLQDYGFVPDLLSGSTRFSRRNDGFAMYNTYSWEGADAIIHLYLDVRIADHPSKPSLAEKSENRVAALTETQPDVKMKKADAAVLDIYCKNHDWGIQIFIGNKDEYNSPVTSFEAMDRILSGKLMKLLSKYD